MVITDGNTQHSGVSKTQYAALEGRTLAYRITGKGSPMMLINRFRGTIDTWDPLFIELLAKHHTVITFDYSGIGYSTGMLPTDIKEVAKDIKDLGEYLKLKDVTAMGWSYGGLVAQVATLQYPELIKQLVLLGTGPVGKREVPLETAFLERALKPINDFDDEIVLFFEPDSPQSVVAANASHNRIHKHLDVSKIPATQEVFQRYFEGGATAAEDKDGFREMLKTTKTPILVISGDHDISFAVENWYPLTRMLPTTQFIVFPKTGHAPHHQYPEMVANYIESFLKNY